MTEFTKERLMALSNRENVGAICSDEIVAMARQLLASMEQEPVAWRWFHLKQWHVNNDEARARNLAWDGVNVTPLYAAPQLPQPAVQNMHHDAKCDLFRPQVVNGVFVPRHGDCSAAMLQGAEPVSQPYTLREGVAAIRNSGIAIDAGKIQAERDALNEPDVPDGYALVPVDMTPEQMRAVQLNSELGAYAAANFTGAYSLFREFWDVAIAAAPDFREISNSSTEHFRENAETSTKCWCHTCRPVTTNDARFVVCPDCGNKRCPHANDHRNACTGSNDPGQEVAHIW